MKIETEIVGIKELEKALTQEVEGMTSAVARAVNVSLLQIHSDIVFSIARGTKTGRKYAGVLKAGKWEHKPKWKRGKNKGGTHRASAQGEAPATDTGELVRKLSAKFVKSKSKAVGIITSGADYSEWLEFGTMNMEKRPFIKPAIKKNRKSTIKRIEKALND